MEQNDEIEMQLWEYMDGACTEAEHTRIAGLVATDSLWRTKFDELSVLHTSISHGLEMEQPSMRFTKNVLDSVAAMHVAPATNQYINKSIIRGIAAFFIITISSLLIYALATADFGAAPSRFIPDLRLGDLNLSSIFNSTFFNIVIAINIVLVLVLVDSVLRRNRAKYTIE